MQLGVEEDHGWPSWWLCGMMLAIGVVSRDAMVGMVARWLVYR